MQYEYALMFLHFHYLQCKGVKILPLKLHLNRMALAGSSAPLKSIR